MKYSYIQSPSANYAKTLASLEKSLRTGQYAGYSQQKKREIWDRLCGYARQLGIKIKAAVVTACVAAGLSFATPVEAQVTFAVQSGGANPLNGVSVYYFAKPAFVDIDGDGDKDVFIGSYLSTNGIAYYKNTGTSISPVFTFQAGGANPLNGATGSNHSAPAFADIDGDGDKDVFIGSFAGTIIYYKNTGTPAAPVFALQGGASNPFNGVSVSNDACPAFVDIDGDGDLDAFIGANDGTIRYYKNTGTASVPAFTVQAGASNPFNGVDIGSNAAPAFVDLNLDGDADAFIGAGDGTIRYYSNTGTASVPVFTVQAGAANPFNGVNVGSITSPAIVDINGDAKPDVFIGTFPGGISYYKNTSTTLPLQLLGFSGSHQQGYNQLQWQTAAEVNTRQFELETSSNGLDFTTIATVNAAGSGNNHYSYQDKTVYSGKLFYRLKMIDIDGRFTYSQTIWINNQQAAGVSLYPNPARGVVNIHLGNPAMINTTAVLYSANGSLLQNILLTAPQQQINVQSLAKGVYVLKFADGTVSGFIKE